MAAHSLPRRSPESQGVDRAGLDAFFAALNAIPEMHSVMLMRHGSVVAEAWWAPYNADREHMLFSLSKSFTSTAIGMLIAEGRLRLDDPVLKFFADEAPAEPGENLRAMTVEHLLMMGTGHEMDTTLLMIGNPDATWTKTFLSLPVAHAPGTFFLYNTGATYMLSVIASRLSGGRLLDYLRPRLFEPLGITGGSWEQSPQGYDTGGFGLTLKTEDIARFGTLYLQKGMFDGKRILSEEWVARATRKHIACALNNNGLDWEQGYGYQFWRCQHNIYRGDGAFGQYCVVMNDHDTVLAITSSVANMQQVLDAAWTHLLPAFGAPAAETQGSGAYAPADLHIPQLPVASVDSPLAAQLSGRTYTLESNPRGIKTLQISFTGTGGLLTLVDASGPHSFAFAHGAEAAGRTTFNSRDGQLSDVITTAGWQDAHTLALRLVYIGGPFSWTFTSVFDADGRGVTVDADCNRAPPIAPPGYTLRGTSA